MSVILMTTLFYKALILQGEIWCWSLTGFKGLSRSSWPWGFDVLDPSTSIFTSVSVDSSPRSYLITSGRLCPNSFSHDTKVWHTTYPICDAPLFRSARRSFVPLQKSRRNHRSFVWTEIASGMVFVLAQEYRLQCEHSLRHVCKYTCKSSSSEGISSAVSLLSVVALLNKLCSEIFRVK